jgi:hypothetical protein
VVVGVIRGSIAEVIRGGCGVMRIILLRLLEVVVRAIRVSCKRYYFLRFQYTAILYAI